MEYRIEQLARTAGVAVDTIRFYQGKGLLEAPRREGRVTWYGDSHVERLKRIKELQQQGFTLTVIQRFLAGELEASDEALVAAVTRADAHAGRAGGAQRRRRAPAAQPRAGGPAGADRGRRGAPLPRRRPPGHRGRYEAHRGRRAHRRAAGAGQGPRRRRRSHRAASGRPV